MVRREGLEPPTVDIEDRCSNSIELTTRIEDGGRIPHPAPLIHAEVHSLSSINSHAVTWAPSQNRAGAELRLWAVLPR